MSKKKGGGDDGPTAPFWMMTYGDVMTLLLTFFVLLLSFSSIQEAKFQEAIGAMKNALGVLNSHSSVLDQNAKQTESAETPTAPEVVEEEKEEVVEILENLGLTDEFDVVTTDDGYAVRLSSPVLFALGDAELKSEADTLLQTLAEFLARKDHPVRVEGHTDNVPINTTRFPSNWELSTTRALSVLKRLHADGLEQTRLSAVGYGEFRPLLANDTVENRAVNRRVELYVTIREAPVERGRELFWSGGN